MDKKIKYFHDDLLGHKDRVYKYSLIASNKIIQRAYEHDNDKLLNPIVHDIYSEYSEEWRKADHVSQDENYQNIKATMRVGLDAHTLIQRHHFYSNEIENITLFDYIEAICDWIGAIQRYTMDNDTILEHLHGNLDRYIKQKEIHPILMNTARELLGE